MQATNDRALWAHLHYIELGSNEPERLARWYETAFGMSGERRGESWICHGPERTLLISPGRPNTLLSAGYELDDRASLDSLAARLSTAAVAMEAEASRIFTAGQIQFRDPAGNKLEFGCGTSRGGGDSLKGRLQHVVFASRNAQKMVDFYTSVVGFRESDRVLDEAGALRTSFMRSDQEHHSLAFFQTNEDRLDHHCYEAGEWDLIRDWGDHFASLRIPVKWGPGRHGPGNNLFLFIHDPDNNWVEISAEIENVSDDRPVGKWAHEERTLNSWGSAPLRI